MRSRIALASVLLLIVVACTHFTKRSALWPSRGPAAVDGVPFLKDFTPDPKLKTVCGMTINSQEELEAFKEGLSPKQFQFVELVDGENSDWFDKACASSISCDILVISGHFTGNFSGRNGSLSTQKIETMSCNNSCGHILQNPREVYMFGCNTLAGKTPDFRSPEEYVQALMHPEYGLTHDQAEMVAAYRYSEVGSANYDRMRRIFKNVPNIYGFDSSAPLGKNVKHMLIEYFEKTGANYSEHMSKVSGKENGALEKSLKVTNFIQAHGDNTSFNPVCYLSNSQIGSLEKNRWIERSLSSDKPLENLPYIYNYLRSLPNPAPLGRTHPRAIVFKIQGMEKPKAKLFSLMDTRLQDFMFVQVQLANFAKFVGWMSEGQYREKITSRLFNPRQEFSHTAADLICGMDIQAQLTAQDIPEGWWSQRAFIRALGCMRVQDPAIRDRVMRMTGQDRDFDVRRDGIELLQTMPDPDNILGPHLLSLFENDTDDQIKMMAANAIGQMQPLSDEVRKRLAFGLLRMVEAGGSYSKVAAVESLRRMNSPDPQLKAEILRLISHHEEFWVRILVITSLVKREAWAETATLDALIEAMDLSQTYDPPRAMPVMPTGFSRGDIVDARRSLEEETQATLSRYEGMFGTYYTFDGFGSDSIGAHLTDAQRLRLAQLITQKGERRGARVAAEMLNRRSLTDAEGLNILLQTAQNSSAADFRRASALVALRGSVNQPEVSKVALQSLREDSSAHVRERAGYSLFHLPTSEALIDEVLEIYRLEKSPDVRSRIESLLIKWGKENSKVILALLETLYTSQVKTVDMRWGLLSETKTKDPVVLAKVKSLALTHPDERVRAIAFNLFQRWKIDSDDYYQFYVQRFKEDPSLIVKGNIMRTLVALGFKDRKTWALFLDELKRTKSDWYLTGTIIDVFRSDIKIRDPEILQAIRDVAALPGQSRGLVQQALQALDSIGR